MRVSYLLAGFGSTGGSMVLYKFMDKLCERGYEVFAITPNGSTQWMSNGSRLIIDRLNQNKSIRDILFESSVRTINKFHISKIAKYVLHINPCSNLYSQTLKLIKNWIPSDVTISTYWTTAYANYALMDKTIPLYHMQAYEELFSPDESIQKLTRLTYYLPLVQIANSSWLLDIIKNNIGKTPYLLNPGIDTDVFYPRVNIEEKYSNMSEVLIFSYYSPVRLKDWIGAVEAMKIVFEQVSDKQVKWICFGGKPSLAPEVPVKFMGKLYGNDLAQMYSKAHITFMNSWYESFPLPPIEAMASGTAVVTTKLGTEDYAFHENNALVIPPRRPDLLAEAIIKLIDNPSFAMNLAKNGVNTARQFTWDKAVNRLEEIFRETVDFHEKDRFDEIRSLLAFYK